MVRKILLICLLLLSVILTGCQTVAGFGRDVTWSAEKTAEALEQTGFAAQEPQVVVTSERNPQY